MKNSHITNHWKRPFFLIWIGQAFSLFGSSLVDFALVWYLTETTGSERVLVIGYLVMLLPRMVLGPFAGSIVDRLSRKKVMIASDGGIALVTIALLLLTALGHISTLLVLFVLFLRSMGAMFHQPAMKSATALLVPEEHLNHVGGMNRILTGGMNIISPIAGAVMIEAFSLISVLMVDVLTAAIAVFTLFVSSIPNPKRTQTRQPPSVLRETAEGLRYVFSHKPLWYVMCTSTLANFCWGPAEALKSLLVTSVFGGGVMELSWITAASGAGLIAGGALLGVCRKFPRLIKTAGLSWGLLFLSYIPIYFLPGNAFRALVVCMFFCSVALAVGSTCMETFYQVHVPNEYQGRVFSVLITVDSTTIPIGLLAAATLGDAMPVTFWYLGSALLHLGLCFFWTNSRVLRDAELNHQAEF